MFLNFGVEWRSSQKGGLVEEINQKSIKNPKNVLTVVKKLTIIELIGIRQTKTTVMQLTVPFALLSLSIL